jgi:4-amino-4-deoxy-L-arabinose transferase-like glycosyltransferase
LWDQDEPYFARTAVEMHERHDLVVPYFNGELFPHKPPFMYWMMQASASIFGETEFAVRLPSAIFGLMTALLVYHLGRKMFNARVGLWAAFATSTALMFDVVARAATPDSFLVFFSTLALYIWVRHEKWEDSETAALDSKPGKLPIAVGVGVYVAMALAVLVKGPIGILLPGCTIGLYLLVRNPIESAGNDRTWVKQLELILLRFSPLRIVRTIWNMRPFLAVACVLAVAGPWYALVGMRTGWEFIDQFFGAQNYGRFMNAMDNHSGAIWYYYPAILVGFFPWSIFFVPMIVDLVKRASGSLACRKGARFLACWIIVDVGFFSLAGTKLPSYVLPAYPALALAAACFLQRWLTMPASVSRWWPRASFGSLTLVGVLMAGAAYALTHFHYQDKTLLELLEISPGVSEDLSSLIVLGCVLALSGVGCIALAEFQRRRAAAGMLAVTAISFCVMLFAGIAVQIDRLQPCPEIAEAIRKHAIGPFQVAQFNYFRPSLVYYTEKKVEACKNPQSIIDFLEQSPDCFVVTTGEEYSHLASELPADIIVVDRRPDFPKAGELVVLVRPEKVALTFEETLQR